MPPDYVDQELERLRIREARNARETWAHPRVEPVGFERNGDPDLGAQEGLTGRAARRAARNAMFRRWLNGGPFY